MSSKLSWNTRKTEDKRTTTRVKGRRGGIGPSFISAMSSKWIVVIIRAIHFSRCLFFSDFCRITKTNFLLEFPPFFLYSSTWRKNTHGICRYIQKNVPRVHTHSNWRTHKMMKICECALSLLSQCHLFRESISVVNSPNETHISIENKLLIIAWDPFGKQRTVKYYPYGLLCTYCHLDTVLRIQ